MKYFILLPLFLFTFTACEENLDAQWDDMMQVHDEVMPKTGELVRMQKNLQNVPNAEPVIQRLEDAEMAMMGWMDDLVTKQELEQMERDAALDYLENKTEEIVEVKSKTLSSLEEAEELLATQ